MSSMKVDASRGIKKVEQAQKALEEYYDTLRDLGDKTLSTLRERTPVDTGETAKSWKLQFNSTSRDKVAWKVSPEGREEVAGYLEYGTKPHVILPKEKQALRFEIDGEEVFAKSVYHPGTKPLGFIRQTKDDLQKWAMKAHEKLKSRLKQIWS